MRLDFMSLLFAGLLLAFCAAGSELSAANKLQINAQTVQVGQTGVAIPVKLDNDQLLYGFSLSIQTDSAKLKIIGLDTAGTAASGAGWSFGQVLQDGSRISWGVVLDVTEPFDTNLTIPVGQQLTIANLKVDVIATQDDSATVAFQDFTGNPVAKNLLVGAEGVTLPLTTQNGTITIQGSTEEPLFRRGDTDNNNRLELTDAVRVLSFLFLGTGEITCNEAADADDNGKVELTDAVRILGFLFLGQVSPADPGPPPAQCGPDPAGSSAHIGCDSYSC
jgi:hypothetical protein